MIRRPPRSTLSSSSAASDVYKRQVSVPCGVAALNAIIGSHETTDHTLRARIPDTGLSGYDEHGASAELLLSVLAEYGLVQDTERSCRGYRGCASALDHLDQRLLLNEGRHWTALCRVGRFWELHDSGTAVALSQQQADAHVRNFAATSSQHWVFPLVRRMRPGIPYTGPRVTGLGRCCGQEDSRSVQLAFRGSHIQDAQAASQGVAHLGSPETVHLQLNFAECEQLIDVSALATSVEGLRGLQHLHLEFSDCAQLSDVSVLGASVRGLTDLQHLNLNFFRCTQLSDVSALGASVGELTGLQHLHLNFGGCKQLSDLAALGASVGNLTALQHLHLNFGGCKQLSDISALGASVGGLVRLQHLDLKFEGCVQLSDVSPLGASVAGLVGLQHLDLNFGGCFLLPESVRPSFHSRPDFLQALCYDLEAIPSLQPEDLDFSRLGTEFTPIDGAENRAITVDQLRGLCSFLMAHASSGGWLDGWTDRAPPEYSWTSGRRLNVHSINLHQVSDWVIKPATVGYKCSYVELVCNPGTQEQPPAWFCSHWWGGGVLGFIKGVEHHAQKRCLGDQSAFWVCAYSNNQHKLTTDITIDPRESSFCRAMQRPWRRLMYVWLWQGCCWCWIHKQLRSHAFGAVLS
eukprot:TRINITY_DN15228_c0_g1_i6.p1 TRINITY_DN15228_c0_g1~~TRINITY_DN15228_c0_g1_i6.p1  ORF type:complete len:633 (+),score=78.57 TRINITY_DN15228_c0_g1_i6:142-2040(+)